MPGANWANNELAVIDRVEVVRPSAFNNFITSAALEVVQVFTNFTRGKDKTRPAEFCYEPESVSISGKHKV